MDLDKILTGQTGDHLERFDGSFTLHREVVPRFRALRAKAKEAGFELEIVSGFRDFEAQLRIWNRKATGQKPLLDDKGNPLEFGNLTAEQIIFAILRWSALPGASRHHWGTDLDVVDRKAIPEGYQVQLTPAEVAPEGMFGKLHEWLDAHMEEEGFFRPYAQDLGGVSPERWHLSFAPLAERYAAAYSHELLRNTISAAEMELKEDVLALSPTLYQRFVTNISPPRRRGRLRKA